MDGREAQARNHSRSLRRVLAQQCEPARGGEGGDARANKKCEAGMRGETHSRGGKRGDAASGARIIEAREWQPMAQLQPLPAQDARPLFLHPLTLLTPRTSARLRRDAFSRTKTVGGRQRLRVGGGGEGRAKKGEQASAEVSGRKRVSASTVPRARERAPTGRGMSLRTAYDPTHVGRRGGGSGRGSGGDGERTTIWGAPNFGAAGWCNPEDTPVRECGLMQ